MRKAMSRKVFLGLPALAVAGLLAGCHIDPAKHDAGEILLAHTFDSANWQQMRPTVRPQVEPITRVHTVNFAPGSSDLSDAEVGALVSFLEKSGVNTGARIEIDGPRRDDRFFDPLTAARLAEIEAELSGLGLDAEVPDRPIRSLARSDEDVAVTVTRATVIEPDCSTEQPSLGSRPDFTYSCSNAAILGRMVAEPTDLVRGRTLGPADAEAATRPIKQYRSGKTETLKDSGL